MIIIANTILGVPYYVIRVIVHIIVQVTRSQLIFGNGASELIDLLAGILMAG